MNHLPHALAYATAAFPLAVFPLVSNTKVPAIKGGFYAATTNPETIKRYRRIPERNIGIRTGIASNAWVLDLDPPDGEDGIRRLEAEHGPLPETRTVLTPRGGFHFWFRYSGPIPCTESKIAPHVDTRGDGGYVAAVPSVTWTAPIPGSEIPKQSWPSHLIGSSSWRAKSRSRRSPSARSPELISRSAQAAMPWLRPRCARPRMRRARGNHKRRAE